MRDAGVEPLTRDLRRSLPRSIRQRAVLSLDRRSDRRRPDSRRELSEPGRLRHPGPRRDRRLERHAGVRPPEDQERRDSQMRRRDDEAGARRRTCCRSCCWGWRGARWASCSRVPASRRFPRRIGASLGAMRTGLTASAVGQGVSVGMLVSLLFSLVPLLEVRRVKPLLLLRGGTNAGISRPDTLPGWWTAAGMRAAARARSTGCRRLSRSVVSAALVAIASWQAASLRVGLMVSLGLPESPSCCTWRAAPSSLPCDRWRMRSGFRCVTRCSVCAGPATRPA